MPSSDNYARLTGATPFHSPVTVSFLMTLPKAVLSPTGPLLKWQHISNQAMKHEYERLLQFHSSQLQGILFSSFKIVTSPFQNTLIFSCGTLDLSSQLFLHQSQIVCPRFKITTTGFATIYFSCDNSRLVGDSSSFIFRW